MSDSTNNDPVVYQFLGGEGSLPGLPMRDLTKSDVARLTAYEVQCVEDCDLFGLPDDEQTEDPDDRPDDETVDLTAVTGIGEATATKLTDLGIKTAQELAQLDPNDLPVEISEAFDSAKIAGWIQSAQEVLSGGTD